MIHSRRRSGCFSIEAATKGVTIMDEQNWNQQPEGQASNQGDAGQQLQQPSQNPSYSQQQYSQPRYPQQPYYQQPYPAYAQPQPGKSKAIASLILGICAIVFCWIPVIPVILAIIGFVMYSGAKKQGFRGGVLTGALVVNIIGLIFSVLYTIFYIVLIAGIAAYGSYLNYYDFWDYVN